MALYVNFQDAVHVVDRLADFNDAADRRYIAVYVPFGTGRHAFGDLEFKTMEEFFREFKSTANDHRIDPDVFAAEITEDRALFEFPSKHLYVKFMDAMYGKNVPRDNLIVQVSAKSQEWLHAAGQYLSYENRARLQAHPDAKLVTSYNVPTFGGQLVNFSFPDVAMLRNFCKEIRSGAFEKAEHVMRAASQVVAISRQIHG